ncbi:thioredoxin-dependent thiol peroxidase [Alicyclobacillus acidocaldarius]|uniref:thioredoxin-dependent peroxiredoxin n=1 Tax=Alicyclobacillus acidocaldarius subsp. acidocaldarius (strain ATCC 27009 / DSM 446 / BCRC 14685 / JCM 5260 / KCTC 1825 / NBRC 15652 / NCIMB 11725 / NRRL B-14509 / 104-IA) TaxID=521098 RepID=C8WVF6_ALIAD|nr:thioredoxin-dependent thiol peroxidase [Alicyclobacillus acidocaldarius]ACV58078.1 alkyl hydroperoxide reductase/ Thiol specific antioxidant/ Mal allergen [Alicyclobacillus acidocaldarius subsp. acidocaldarius DSM 446]
MALEVGVKAPEFSAESDSGEIVKLSDLRGKVVVLYFYPKDDTPGCTQEACAFRDLKSRFEEAGAVIYGVSRDDIRSHAKFRDKHGLNFPLLSDPDGQICQAYDVLKEKNMYGRKTIGIERTTYVIDRDGAIAAVFPKVKVDGHAEEVLAKVREVAG